MIQTDFAPLSRSAGAPDIAVLTIDNPPVNAVSIGVPRAVIAALDAAAQDDGISGVLLCAGGKGALAGADIKAQGKPWPEDEPNLRDMITALEASPKPVAALLRGYALGGGLEIGLGCLWRAATPGARLGLPESSLGIPPGAGGTQRLPRIVGAEKALDMILTAKPILAEAAQESGLIDHLADPAESR